jgi:hypothetical protein
VVMQIYKCIIRIHAALRFVVLSMPLTFVCGDLASDSNITNEQLESPVGRWNGPRTLQIATETTLNAPSTWNKDLPAS